MPWLADLVESSEGSLNVLPVQCLCEFLLNSSLTNVDDSDFNTTISSGKLKNQNACSLMKLMFLSR